MTTSCMPVCSSCFTRWSRSTPPARPCSPRRPRSRARCSHDERRRDRRSARRPPGPDQAIGQRRAQAHGARAPPALDRGGARHGPAGGADAPGRLLRHPGSRPGPSRRRRARPSRTGKGRRLRRQAAARGAGHAAGQAAPLRQLPGRGRRAPRWLRLLRHDEGRAAARRRARGARRRALRAQALLQGAARLLRRARARGRRARRPLAARPDLRAQAAHGAARARQPPAGGRAVAVPGRLARARALDPLRDRRGVPGRGRDPGLPRPPRGRPRRRAADEDPQGARLLRRAARMTVAARWEWRTFGDGLGAAEGRLASLTPERVEVSDELYLLSLASDASVKVRDGRLDAKRLLNVGDGGLEQWTPVLKATFPLSVSDLGFVLALLGADASRAAGGAESAEALIAIADADPDLLAVRVGKHREHYTLDGCMAERSELRTDAGAVRTIAVESLDPASVRAVVRELRLTARPVTCVARGLKALVGFGGRRYAVIDVGTNSVKFHVGERSAVGGWRTIVDRAEVTRLGERQGPDGRLDATAMARTAKAIAAMAAEARRLGAAELAAVGTAGLRMAPNAAELVAAVQAACGVTVEVLSAQEEARLAYAAATHGLDGGRGSLLVFDTGGGSSQFSFAT